MSCFNVNKMRMRQRLDDFNKQDHSASQVHALKNELAKLKSEHSLEFERTRKQLSQALEIIENNHKTINELRQNDASRSRVQGSQHSQDVRRAVFNNKFENRPNGKNEFENDNDEDKRESEDSFDQKSRIVSDFNRRSNDKDIHRVISANPNPIPVSNNHQKSGKKISFAQPSSRSVRTSNRPNERGFESEDENSEDSDDRNEFDGKAYDQVDGKNDDESFSEYESDEDNDGGENYESDNYYSEKDEEEDEREYSRNKQIKTRKNNQKKETRKIRFR